LLFNLALGLLLSRAGETPAVPAGKPRCHSPRRQRFRQNLLSFPEFGFSKIKPALHPTDGAWFLPGPPASRRPGKTKKARVTAKNAFSSVIRWAAAGRRIVAKCSAGPARRRRSREKPRGIRRSAGDAGMLWMGIESAGAGHKPNFVSLRRRDGNHSSGPGITPGIKQSTQKHWTGRPSSLSGSAFLFDLAPCGVFPAIPVTRNAVRSYRTFSPLPRKARRCIFCGTFRRVAPPSRYEAHCPVEFGLSSTCLGPRLPVRLRQCNSRLFPGGMIQDTRCRMHGAGSDRRGFLLDGG
jgi:hypothetical protein